MQLLLGGGGHRNHVIDEDGEALRLGQAVDAEVFLHLLEDHVGVPGEIVDDHEVGLGHDFVAGPHGWLAGHPRQNLLDHGVAHRSSRYGVA